MMTVYDENVNSHRDVQLKTISGKDMTMPRHLDSQTLGKLLGLALVIVLLTLVGGSWQRAHAEQPPAPSGTEIWVDVPETSFRPRGERLIVPDRYRTLALNEPALQALLATAPLEGDQAARTGPVILALPLPDGTFGRFQIVESPIMAPELAAEFPEHQDLRRARPR